MKLLYIAVHRHTGWGAEYWLARAFERMGHSVERYDYRQRRRHLVPWWMIRRELATVEARFQPDAVLLQRAERMPAPVPAALQAPVVFWSTEPLVRRRDADQLLARADLFAWVYLHTYTCLEYVAEHFPTLVPKASVMHNATGLETLSDNTDRPRLAVFNRNLSARRRQWLAGCEPLVEVIEGRFGPPYFSDLAHSQIALNIHYADASVDDFETGIFEALASGCAVVTERLNPRTVNDMKMADALWQVDSPGQMRTAIETLRNQPTRLAELQNHGMRAIRDNLWEARARQMLDKFAELSKARALPN